MVIPSLRWVLVIRLPPACMPVPRRRGGGILCPRFLFSSSARFRRRIVDNAFLNSDWYLVGTESKSATFCMDPPIATRQVNFFFSGFVSVVLTCKLIHLFDDLFRTSHFKHRLPENFITDVSDLNAVVLLFTAFLCKLIRCKTIFTSKCFSIPMTVWSMLSDVEIRYGECVKHRLRCTYFLLSAETFVIRCPHVQYIILVLQCLKHNLHCHLGSTLTISQISIVSCIYDCNLWLVAECIEWLLLLLKIILNCCFLWMTCDSLNQIMNVKIFENVSPSHRECRRRWNQCSRHPSQGWTYLRHHDFWDDNLLALCAVFPLHQVSLIHRDFRRFFLPPYRVAPIYRKN